MLVPETSALPLGESPVWTYYVNVHYFTISSGIVAAYATIIL